MTTKTGSLRAKSLTRRTLAVLCVLQMLGIGAAVVAAAVDIETLMVSGPAFSSLGILIAALGVWTRNATGVLFGLSAAAVSFFCFAAIYGNHWGPSEAEEPVFLTVVVAYCTLFLPTGAKTLFPAAPIDQQRRPKRRWQFSLWSLMTLITSVAVVLGLRRWMGTAALLPILLVVGATGGSMLCAAWSQGAKSGGVIGAILGLLVAFGIQQLLEASEPVMEPLGRWVLLAVMGGATVGWFVSRGKRALPQQPAPKVRLD